jgi:S-sulfosulfanyl-L-cysteine sulfohydrolase
VAGWAPVSEDAKNAPGAKPIWELVESWLKTQGGRVKPRRINTPTLTGVQGNPGIARTGSR